jgi:hypothetical protein
MITPAHIMFKTPTQRTVFVVGTKAPFAFLLRSALQLAARRCCHSWQICSASTKEMTV